MKKIYLSSTIIPLFAAAEFLSHDLYLAAFVAMGFCAIILYKMEQYDNSTPGKL